MARIAIFSATSLMAQHCARIWASSRDCEFVLVGRSITDLDSLKADLIVRFPGVHIENIAVDFSSVEGLASCFEEVFSRPVDIGLVAQGSLTDQARASSDIHYLDTELAVNMNSVGLCLELFADRFSKQEYGSLGVIGSVAGDRGRAYNYSYGATKAFIEKYVQGLQQRFANGNVSVTLIKPGPTATPMTTKHKGRMGSPEHVAKDIVKAIDLRRRVIYSPGIWRYIMLVVKAIPFSIFKKLSF